ncbi:MAG: MOSC domain-containing protein [Ignavibacteriales bacterium]|nr:MAG: MOSC domain-containing protein [Ignavibacteriales bacterium]
MKKLLLTEINIFPVKSLSGYSVNEGVVEKRGLKHDRRWLLINEQSDFMTQRDYPQMTLLKAVVEENYLVLSKKNDPSDNFRIKADNFSPEIINVPIWNDRCDAHLVSKQVDEWLSDHLNTNCRIVYMPDTTSREVDKRYAHNNEIVSFADGYPFMIIGQSSLDDLNSRMETVLPMNRFRTNFVFTGGEPFEEDRLGKFRMGELIFHAVKPCERCVIPTTDQETAERAHEPLKTLATFRKQDGKVMFGQNLLCESTGVVKVGDELIPL